MGIAYLELTGNLVAGEIRKVSAAGKTLAILSITGSLRLRVDSNETTTIRAGMTFKLPDGFEELFFEETLGAPASFVIAISEGDILDNRLSVNTTLTVKSGDTLGNPAAVSVGVAATPIVAASASRNSVEVFNNHATEILYVGGAGVTTATGRPVFPKTGWSIDTGAALYGIVGAGTVDTRIITVDT